MTKKRILYIWNYFYFESEKGLSRFPTLLKMLSADFDIEVITSSFYHMGKCFHNIDNDELNSLPYKVTFIKERGYKKNISIKRVRSINDFNDEVKHYLYNQLTYKPDIVYIPVPSNKMGLIASEYCKAINCKLVVDIEDLWPESFKMILKSKSLVNLLFNKQLNEENTLYRNADAITAVSQKFLSRALSVRKSTCPNCVSYIGSDFSKAKSVVKESTYKKPSDEIWVTYIGTLGKSYDLKRVIDVFKKLQGFFFSHIKFKILGSGPDEDKLKKHVNKNNITNVEFLGLLPYKDMIEILSVSDYGINPIVPNSVASIINKVADYASVGLPVINTQNCKEYMNIIDECNAGINVVPFDKDKIFNILIGPVFDKNKVNNNLLREKFDRNIIYPNIIEMLKRL